MNIQLEKANIIELIQRSNDVDLIKALKSLLEYSSKKEIGVFIPEWHKAIVKKRWHEAETRPEKLLTWNDIMEELGK